MATRSDTSTTSSPKRRPFGKPAASPATTPSEFCAAAAVAAMPVFKRSISARGPPAPRPVMLPGRLTVGSPVRKAVIRSVRGKFVGALAPNSVSTSAGSVGCVT